MNTEPLHKPSVFTPVDLDDLPKYSKWPERIFGDEPWEQRVKNNQELDREYEQEQWRPMLEQIKADPSLTVCDMDHQMFKAEKIMCRLSNGFYTTDGVSCYDEFHHRIFNFIGKFLPGKSVLAEVGAGYGSIILNLAKKVKDPSIQFHAYEWTQSGKELIKELATRNKNDLNVGHCDLNANQATDTAIPKQSLVYTCSVFPCIPKLSEQSLLSLAPYTSNVVIHIEPIYEEFSGNSLWEMMVRSYLSLNDYNKNALSLLRKLENENKIEILN